jgi:hypothetical protein
MVDTFIVQIHTINKLPVDFNSENLMAANRKHGVHHTAFIVHSVV